MNLINSFNIENEVFYYYDLNKVFESNAKLKKLPIVLKILLEANLRKAKNDIEVNEIIQTFIKREGSKICLYSSRIILQDFAGIPMIVDLAMMRDWLKENGFNPKFLNPKVMVDLVIDHFIDDEKLDNINENEENKQKYEFVKWAKNTFSNLRVIPPGSGICHQVNLEYLSTILHLENIDDKNFIYPETILGTDSHTTMINSLGVLGWQASVIDVEAVMLGLPLSLDFPKVVGVNIYGKLKEVVSSADLVNELKSRLEKEDLQGKLIEFYGEGLRHLTLEDKSIISSMAPEYRAKCSFFAIDDKSISYFNKTRGTEDYGVLLKEYLKKQNLFNEDNNTLEYDEVIDFDLSLLEPIIIESKKVEKHLKIEELYTQKIVNNGNKLKDLDIVLATITSCSNITNPYLLIHAGLVAKKAYELGLKVSNNTKAFYIPSTSFEKDFLEKLNLLKYFEFIGFHILEYNYDICSENFYGLDIETQNEIKKNNLNVSLITSEYANLNKNKNSLVNSAYLMSPPLLVIYSLIGTTKFNIIDDVFGIIDDKDIRQKDIWPTSKEIGDYLQKLDFTLYKEIYENIFIGNEFWQNLIVKSSDTYGWDENCIHIQGQNFFQSVTLEDINIQKAGILALFEDNISIEQITPRGQISLYSPAAKYLEENGVKSYEYNTFQSRRSNAQVMLRSIFDSLQLKNMMVSKEGPFTLDYETNEIISIFEKSQRYISKNKDLVIIAGENFGIGEFKSWAVRGIKLLGVKAIISKSFDEIYRSNLVKLGILPLEFIDDDIFSLNLKGNEELTISSNKIKENSKVNALIQKNNIDIEIDLKCRLDNQMEVEYFKNGGIIPYLLKKSFESDL